MGKISPKGMTGGEVEPGVALQRKKHLEQSPWGVLIKRRAGIPAKNTWMGARAPPGWGSLRELSHGAGKLEVMLQTPLGRG